MIKKLSVIGGSGFIGTHLCKQLENLNIDFEIIDLEKSKAFPKKTIVADIRDLNSLRHSINGDFVIHLAAIHTDDISEKELYFKTNVEGTKNILKVCDEKKIKSVIFTSSVAVYGFAHPNADEKSQTKPFNYYGESKLEAEKLLTKWYEKNSFNKNLTIIRPTVIFGENNKGNLFKLMKSIYLKKFLMIGPGKNIKSIAYVRNLVDFIVFSLNFDKLQIYNYIDKPDLNINQLVNIIKKNFNLVHKPFVRLPYIIAVTIIIILEFFSKFIKINLPISYIRIKKFCSTTQFGSESMLKTGFNPQYTIEEALQKTIRHEFKKK
jgi:nucleoside-diphosphate-sugar epimerase